MYYGTTGDVLACIFQIALEHPELARVLGLNIEPAHEIMAKLDPAICYGMALECGKLFHIHENGQGEPAFDRDLAAGDDGLDGLLDRMWQLKVAGYKGLLGMDVQPLPGDTDEQAVATISRSVRRMKWAVTKVRLLDDGVMADCHSRHDQAGVLTYIDNMVFGIS